MKWQMHWVSNHNTIQYLRQTVGNHVFPSDAKEWTKEIHSWMPLGICQISTSTTYAKRKAEYWSLMYQLILPQLFSMIITAHINISTNSTIKTQSTSHIYAISKLIDKIQHLSYSPNLLLVSKYENIFHNQSTGIFYVLISNNTTIKFVLNQLLSIHVWATSTELHIISTIQGKREEGKKTNYNVRTIGEKETHTKQKLRKLQLTQAIHIEFTLQTL